MLNYMEDQHHHKKIDDGIFSDIIFARKGDSQKMTIIINYHIFLA